MKVTLYDVDQPDRKIDGQYSIDATLGAPVVGDELLIGERDYNPDRHYVTATVRRRTWLLYDNRSGGGELRLWVQRTR
ncbi:hypothetical protein GCM10010172_06950 [Paractinoplanes ferrugineus]|uniref:Uncharacterized protein n=1 Tax=Paractinoplanes ferrugineus TaxID=113564 RepID=A0A919MQF7_9ACTN|nr:hypothetical protein [Actinoplanes ferrugineus]GIE16277.1 hypothetical protein Afe05nite_81170 [Actinoplanes ferrugineus]